MSALRNAARRAGLALICCCGIAWPQAAFAHHVAGHEEGLWRPEWPAAAILAVSLWFYLAGVRRLWHAASPGRGVSRGEVACFIAGWLVLAAATSSKILQPDKLIILSTTDVKGKTSPCG